MSNPSLDERLGGVYSIAAVVDDFIDRIMVDPKLNSNLLVDDAHHRVSRQVPRHRDGLLGDRGAATGHRALDEGTAPDDRTRSAGRRVGDSGGER